MLKKVAFLLLVLASWPSFVGSQPLQRLRGVVFSNIAPGELENDLVRSLPVKMVFASESGAPYGGVYVRIFNEAGIAVFKHLCEKPWLFVKLAPGDYNVVAVDRKKVQKVTPFKVKKEGEGQTVVKLKWPKEVVGY